MIRFAIQINLLNIDIIFTIIRCFNSKHFTTTHFHFYLFKTRTAESKHTVRRIHLIESHSRKEIPCRHLSTVFITDDTVRLICIEVAHDETNLFRSFPLFAGICIEIGYVMARLIAMRILSDQTGDITGSTFTHTVIVRKEAVELRCKRLVTAKQADQSIRILRSEECILPSVALTEIADSVNRTCRIVRSTP